MKENINITLLIILFIISTSSIASQPALSLKNTSYTYVKSNLEFLSSDQLEGREATSRGEKLAALFISEELEKYGVLPYGDSGSYYQDFTMIVSGYSENSNVVIKNNNGISESIKNGTDVVYSGRTLASNNYAGKDLEIVFVGYGIYSEEDDYNSYEDIDVEGKVVLVLSGTPKIDGEEILGNMTVKKFGRSTKAKTQLAKSKGANGLLLLPSEQLLKYWKSIVKWSSSKSYKLEEEVDKTSKNDIPILMLNDRAAEVLLKDEQESYKSLTLDENPKPTSFTLNAKVNLNYKVSIENRIGRNVIGLIKGNNKEIKSEYITLGAHYDHEGIKGGEVYNGADDNGSGTVTILEVARRLAISGENERPVLVMFHTAEEKGLKGAKYLTQNSKFVDSAIVHFNIDMIGRKSEDSIYCIGASKISKELGKIVEDVNNATTQFYLDYKFDDHNDPQQLYYRSDHIHYANKGIPIAFFYDYMKEDYHRPSDTVDKINFPKIVKMTELIYNLAVEISNLDHKLTVDELPVN